MPVAHDTAEVRSDGRPTPALREELRRIASWRNAGSVVGLYVQTAVLVWVSVRYLWTLPITFLLMGRTFAQFASLMHEAAHRLLFANKRINDWVGRWLLGFPAFTSTDAYRRVHMAHHRDEFGPDEPDIALYAGYPIGHASFRRKLIRDATGRTGLKLMRQLLGNIRSRDARSRRTVWKILAVQAVLLGGGDRLRALVAVPGAVGGAVPHRVAGHQPAALDRRARRHATLQGSPPDHPLGAPAPARPGSCWCRTTSAGTWPTTSIPGCRSATCHGSTRPCARPVTSTPASNTRRTLRSGGR